MATAPRVELFVRAGCHLCDDAQRVCADVCESMGLDFVLVDVDSDADLRALYTDHVPVTVVNGQVVARWFLDPVVFRAALQ